MTSSRTRGLALAAWILFSQTVHASEPVRLTTDGLFKRDLVFCPGGTELAYGVLSLFDGPDKGRVRLMKMKLADGSVTEFVKGAGRELAFSADGNVYAYCVVDNTFMRVAIEVRNVKLDKAMRIERKFFVSRPTLSPDGSRIVFMDGEKLISLELWKDNAKDVVLGEKWDIWPNYSPDGSRIIFTSRRDKDMEIYAMNPDGTQPKRLTNSPGIDMNARFSPDGRQIAFTSNRDGNYEIYVMNADGTNVRRVTNHPERDDLPCWTPDGKHLLFVGERKGKFDIYKVEVPSENKK